MTPMFGHMLLCKDIILRIMKPLRSILDLHKMLSVKKRSNLCPLKKFLCGENEDCKECRLKDINSNKL